jgi:hypothetical protein
VLSQHGCLPVAHCPPALPSRSFDLIFLDANKDGYAGYYGAIMQHCLLAHNGLLVVDNSLMKVGGGPGREAACLHSTMAAVAILAGVSETGLWCRGGATCYWDMQQWGALIINLTVRQLAIRVIINLTVRQLAIRVQFVALPQPIISQGSPRCCLYLERLFCLHHRSR